MVIKISTHKTKDNFYIGKISVYENGRKLWHKYSAIDRLTRNDALNDAKDLRQDVYYQNQMKKKSK